MNKTVVTKGASISPRGDKILLSLAQPEQKTASGIVLPVDLTDKSRRNYVGDVVALGPDAEGHDISVGDRVIFTGGLQYDVYLETTPTGAPSHCLVSWYDVQGVVTDKDANVTVSV